MLQHFRIDVTEVLGNPRFKNERLDRFLRIPAAAQPGNRRHARVVPTVNDAFVNELFQLPFTGHRLR
ncbi:hypothetical protein D3C81_1203600 [compost metagenome]